MPRCFLNSIRRKWGCDASSDTEGRSTQSIDNRQENQRPSKGPKKPRTLWPDLSSSDDWSCVHELSIVTRWELYKLPSVGPGEYSAPIRKLPNIRDHRFQRVDECRGEGGVKRYNLRRNKDNGKPKKRTQGSGREKNQTAASAEGRPLEDIPEHDTTGFVQPEADPKEDAGPSIPISSEPISDPSSDHVTNAIPEIRDTTDVNVACSDPPKKIIKKMTPVSLELYLDDCEDQPTLPQIVFYIPSITRQTHDCPICSKKFDKQCVLKSHMRIHTGEKPFKCPHCDNAYSDKSNLRTHQRRASHHQWKWNCEVCGKAFVEQRFMARHNASACKKYKDLEARKAKRNLEFGWRANAVQTNLTDPQQRVPSPAVSQEVQPGSDDRQTYKIPEPLIPVVSAVEALDAILRSSANIAEQPQQSLPATEAGASGTYDQEPSLHPLGMDEPMSDCTEPWYQVEPSVQSEGTTSYDEAVSD